MPVRKIPKNYRNVTGIASRSKAIGRAAFESTLERDFLTLLEFNPSIESFEAQPLSIDWQGENGKKRIYTPDVLAYFHNLDKPITLYEIKYRSDIRENWQQLKPKFKAGIHYARQRGWRFKIITEQEIRGQRLENAKFLLPFVRKGPQAEPDMDILDAAINQLKESTPAELLSSIYQDEWNRAKLLPTLWYLIGSHQIGTDFDNKLTMSNPIWSTNHHRSNPWQASVVSGQELSYRSDSFII